MTANAESETHVRMLRAWPAGQKTDGSDVFPYIVSCTCGWGDKAYQTKRDAAAAWGHHNAAAQRRTAKKG